MAIALFDSRCCSLALRICDRITFLVWNPSSSSSFKVDGKLQCSTVWYGCPDLGTVWLKLVCASASNLQKKSLLYANNSYYCRLSPIIFSAIGKKWQNVWTTKVLTYYHPSPLNYLNNDRKSIRGVHRFHNKLLNANNYRTPSPIP